MRDLFQQAHSFNTDIGDWDTARVTNVPFMFRGADFSAMAFDRDIGRWDTSKVFRFDSMFFNHPVFNQPLGAWDTSARGAEPISKGRRRTAEGGGDVEVILSSMFQNAKAFDQNISAWDTSKVTNANEMFFDASSFDQDLSGWDTQQMVDVDPEGFGLEGCHDFATQSGCNQTRREAHPSIETCGAEFEKCAPCRINPNSGSKCYECDTDAECSDKIGFTCQDYSCVGGYKCEADGDCPDGVGADVENGKCVAPGPGADKYCYLKDHRQTLNGNWTCSDDSDCLEWNMGSYYYYCQYYQEQEPRGWCAPKSCTFNADCDYEPMICRDAVCYSEE